MYALLAPVLIAVVGLAKPEIGTISTVGLIGNAVGGVMAGIIADKFGRIFVLNITILWVAAFSVLAAFSSNYYDFLAVRFLQGLGYGGEAAVGGVLISEVVRPHLRGRVVSSIQAGYAIGYALSIAIMSIIFNAVPESIGWRIMFLSGVVPAFLVLIIRRLVPESAPFEAAVSARRAGAKIEPFWTIFNPSNLRATLFGLLLAAGIFGCGFGISTWMPTYLRMNLHLEVTSTAAYLGIGILGSLIGPIVSGFSSDRVGRRTNFVIFALCQAAVVSILVFTPFNSIAAFGIIFIHGALQAGMAAGMAPTFTELFRTDIRASGVGVCVTGGRGGASIAPAAVGVLGNFLPLGHAMWISSLSALCVAVIAALSLPERSGADLNTRAR